ncbi:MAG: hypothetical protein HYZ45_00545, partial [Burkholderiales bacterium]|nr:hypothetical protein [Burkholderiales bacterium]
MALVTSPAHALDLGAIVKDSVKKQLQKPAEPTKPADAAANASATASVGTSAELAQNSHSLVPGLYDSSDRHFERTLTIDANGKFDLEVMGLGGPNGMNRNGSGAGQLLFKAGRWVFTYDRCTVTLQPTASAGVLQLNTENCSILGDVPFDGKYRLKDKKVSSTAASAVASAAASAPASPVVATNKQLAAQLNCQKLDFSDKGIASLLSKATKLPANAVWEREIPAPAGYSFGDLPIQSLNLSEADGGFLALFVNGDAAAIQAAMKKAHLKGDKTVASLHKVGEANGYAFPGKAAGQLYVLCKS